MKGAVLVELKEELAMGQSHSLQLLEGKVQR